MSLVQPWLRIELYTSLRCPAHLKDRRTMMRRPLAIRAHASAKPTGLQDPYPVFGGSTGISAMRAAFSRRSHVADDPHSGPELLRTHSRPRPWLGAGVALARGTREQPKIAQQLR